MYGEEKWVFKNQVLNLGIKDWAQLTPDTKLNLEFPFPVSPECLSIPPEVLELPPQVEPEIVARPPQTPTPPPDSPPIVNSPEIISSPDTLSPAVNADPLLTLDLLKSLSSSAIDIRYGRSFGQGPQSILLPKLSQVSVVYESQYAFRQKLRVYFDVTPKIVDSQLDQNFSIASSRVLIGRGFFFTVVEKTLFELTPKVGYWRYSSTMPLDDGTSIKVVNLQFSRQLVLGGELGLSYRTGLFTPRLWYARDFTTSIFKGNSDNAGGTTYRTALEVKYDLKNVARLTKKSRYYILAYGMQESTRITNGNKILSASDVQSGADTEGLQDANFGREIVYHVNYLGLGIGLSW